MDTVKRLILMIFVLVHGVDNYAVESVDDIVAKTEEKLKRWSDTTLKKLDQVEEEIFKAVDQSESPSVVTDSDQENCTISLFYDLVQKSDDFEKSMMQFPTVDNRIKNIAGADKHKQELIALQACASYPIMHMKLHHFIRDFLSYKMQNGTAIEKELYQTMSVDDFIDRLLKKRPLMFMLPDDCYVLQKGKHGKGGFELIGTDQEKAPLILANYLSYDEMQIAALIGVSVPTFFINNGNRSNVGIKSKRDDYEQMGVYVGLVGARFEKPNYMEWEHIIVTAARDKQLQLKKDLFKLWSRFYGVEFDLLSKVQQDKSGRYIKFMHRGQSCYFDTVMYKKRMEIPIYLFLKDAHERGKKAGKKYMLM